MQATHGYEGINAFIAKIEKSIETINQINADLRTINGLLHPLRKENAMKRGDEKDG